MSSIPTPGVSLACRQGIQGTLGFLACFTNSEDPYAVTCSHNLAPNWSTKLPNPTPDLSGGCEVRVPADSLSNEDIIGNMIWAEVLDPKVTIAYDCAILRVSKTALQEVDGIPIQTLWLQEQLPESVRLIAGDIRLAGRLTSQSAMRGPLSIPLRLDGPFDYDNLFEVRYEKATVDGMSGAPVLATSGELVGLHVGALEGRSFFHRADKVLNRLGMGLFRK